MFFFVFLNQNFEIIIIFREKLKKMVFKAGLVSITISVAP